MDNNLVVLTFENEGDAAEVLQTIRRLEKDGVLKLSDSAVVAKDQSGKVHVKNEVSSATEVGAVAGGIIGGLVTFMFPPAGIALGAAAGAAIGAMTGQGVEGKFVKELSEELKPGDSALFLIISSGHAAAFDALKGHKGKIYQTTLSEDLEDRLRKALT